MSKSFKKTCDRGCNTEIEMSDKSGKWLPYNLDGSAHDCQKLRPEPKAGDQNENQKQTELSKQNEEKLKNGNKEEKRLSDWVGKPTFSDSPQWTSYLLAYIADELNDLNKTLKVIMARLS